MEPQLLNIFEAAKGLMYMSESDYPFETIQLEKGLPSDSYLRQMAGKPEDATVEKQTLTYFLRNMVRTDEGSAPSEKETAARFQLLEKTIEENLKDVTVYRVGTIQIDVFIVGRLPDGSYAGLKTRSIET